MKRLKLFIPLIIFALLALIFLFAFERPHFDSPIVGKPMPSFSLPVLGEERTVADSDLLGAPYLLNVWGSWCGSCRVEHPYLMDLKAAGIKIVGVDYKDEAVNGQRWLDSLGNPYVLTVLDRIGNLGLDLGVTGAPETFLIDAEGRVVVHHVGVLDEQVWNKKFAALYGSGAVPAVN